ncbi:agmatinase family protein [Pseudobdellovibrio exovorus]|uniref:Putative arginase n=1 Tax=Pseudobdellovibrio exovorus JSS TaxID=1184267 RepID=M4VB63_9BACT|nr:arginase family protein [Pseudobdellovibrio exovorus]AGH96453.1 putative arginase [Pseudobdellovibrio exovorus JSS]
MSQPTTNKKFDPTTTISSDFGIFGIPYSEAESRLVLLPVPWEVTTSYGKGASNGPRIIRQASEQIDLFDFETKNAYEQGYFMREISEQVLSNSQKYKALAQEVISLRTERSEDTAKIDSLVNQVNTASRELTEWVYQQTKGILDSGKLFGLVGGDHSTPLGAIKAICEKHSANGQSEVGVLHIDAHSDTRKAYQGFEQSHASIMYNVMNLATKPKKLVQVGIRDFCEEEYDFVQSRPDVKTFFDIALKQRLLKGESWASVATDIIQELPQKVYISFDIDGLDPRFCPSTGTPVIGGLSADEVFFLFNLLAQSGRQIVGFDLNEVSSGEAEESEWDGNVGARMLYKLCNWTVVTNK